MKTKTKIICCLMVSILLLSFGLSVSAAATDDPYLDYDGSAFKRWFGMGISSVHLEYFSGTVGTPSAQNPASYYQNKSPFYALSYGFPKGAYDKDISDGIYSTDYVAMLPNEEGGMGCEIIAYCNYADSGERTDLGTFSYLTLSLPTKSNSYYYTTAEFNFESFFVNQSTMDFRNFLYITPSYGVVGVNGIDYGALNMYVTYEYDVVSRQYDSSDGTYDYYKGHQTETAWWDWNAVMLRSVNTNTNGYNVDGCFMPPSIVQPMMAALESGTSVANPSQYIVSNLTVKIYNFVGNYSSAGNLGNEFNNTYYSLTGFGADNDKGNRSYNATIINYNEGGFEILPKLDEWGVLGAPDAKPVEMSWLMASLGGFMQFEIFPNFSIGGILAVIVGISLLIAFLKLFAGG